MLGRNGRNDKKKINSAILVSHIFRIPDRICPHTFSKDTEEGESWTMPSLSVPVLPRTTPEQPPARLSAAACCSAAPSRRSTATCYLAVASLRSTTACYSAAASRRSTPACYSAVPYRRSTTAYCSAAASRCSAAC